MHTSLYKLGGINFNISVFDVEFILETVVRLKVKLAEVYELLVNSSV